MEIAKYPIAAQARINTYSGWSFLNTILAIGQSRYQADSDKLKIGDRISNRNGLDCVPSLNIIKTSFLTMGA
jgi:hypothetical protein